MGWVVFGAFILTTALLWHRSASNLERKGRGWLFRHWVSAVLSTLVATVQTMMLIGEVNVWTFVGIAIAVSVVWLYRQPLPDAQPLTTTDPAWLADIEFDYRDARGNESRRHVHVQAVDDEYLQGECMKAMATRTFVIGRMRGKVLDLASGELIAPKRFAAELRRNPLNDPSLIAREFERDFQPETPEHEAVEADEVCFTGFSKADRFRLEGEAELAGMTVRQSVTKNLRYLVTGSNAGPAKVAQAYEVGAQVIDEAEFISLCADS